MTDTTYTDPSGLKETTVSTAEDQVKLGRAFVKVPALVAISSAASWTDPSGRFWPNYNELPFKIGAIGIKTGSTTAAGGNLALRLPQGGRRADGHAGRRDPRPAQAGDPRDGQRGQQDRAARRAGRADLEEDPEEGRRGRLRGRPARRPHPRSWSRRTSRRPAGPVWKVKLSFASGTVPHTAKAGTRVGTLTVGDGTARRGEGPGGSGEGSGRARIRRQADPGWADRAGPPAPPPPAAHPVAEPPPGSPVAGCVLASRIGAGRRSRGSGPRTGRKAARNTEGSGPRTEDGTRGVPSGGHNGADTRRRRGRGPGIGRANTSVHD